MDSERNAIGKTGCTNENLDRLRELVETLESKSSTECQQAALKINQIVESGKKDIKKARSVETKLKCYEAIFASISTILTGIKHCI